MASTYIIFSVNSDICCWQSLLAHSCSFAEPTILYKPFSQYFLTRSERSVPAISSTYRMAHATWSVQSHKSTKQNNTKFLYHHINKRVLMYNFLMHILITEDTFKTCILCFLSNITKLVSCIVIILSVKQACTSQVPAVFHYEISQSYPMRSSQ